MSAERTPPGRVLVGIDGSRASRYAARWAATEARIRRTSLIITHVEPSAANPDDHGTFGFASDALLELSASAASQREPSITVGTMLLAGSISDELIKLSESAAMLVLGVDLEHSRATHGALGPIEDRVVVHAKCPVVTVSSAARTFEHDQPFVVVGWSDNKTGHRALAAAAAEAELREARLTVVSVTPELEGAERGPQGGSSHERALVRVVRSLLRSTHPGLAIDIVQSSGEVSQALVRHSWHADVLVVGCHHTGDRWSVRMGPVAESVMRQAACPVMLVGRSGAARMSVQDLFPDRHEADELSR